MRLTDFSEKYELTGSINISNTAWGYGINGGSFSSLSHTNSSGIKDYVITGSFIYSALGTIDGATITSVEINQSNGKLLLKGTLNLDANEVITGGTITSISYTAPDGKSFAISNILLNVADLQSVLQSAGSSSDFSTLSSFFLNSANLTGNDTIIGDIEANVLDGAGGVDNLVGSLGDDTYIVDLTRSGTTAANYKVALQDTITETAVAGSGTDTVQLRLLAGTDYSAMANATTLTLGANLENFDASLTADTKLNLTGNTLANTLTGNDADNILDGGAGVDTLIGGAGNDTYILDVKLQGTGAGATVVIEDTVTDLNGTTNGIDTVKLRGTAALATATELSLTGNLANIEILDASATGSTRLNLTANNNGNTLIGNAAANILTGGTGNDTLNGGAGIDTMIGGNGNDTYIVDNIADVVTEINANQVTGGTDLVKASVSYTLGANVENLELTGTAAINGTGNAGANVITGNTGNNIIDGGAGIDTLIGGKGNDTYIVDHISDVVTELENEGIDLVKANATHTLSANVENLTLTDGSVNGGTAAINGTGNALANTITGNAGSNVLDGGDGADKLISGNGDDTYIVDLALTGTTAANFKVSLQDTITETAVANSGIDTVQLRLLAGTNYGAMANATTLTLGANLENLDASLTADTKLNLTGNALANTLKGNDADNILDGGAGVDTLIGGEGDDTYVLDLKTATINSVVTAVVEDTVTETGGTTNGIDTIKLRGAATLATATTLTLNGDWANAEVLDASATGLTKLNLTANNNGNTLIGNAAANILTGGTGNDTLNGGAGIDTMAGGNGNDTYIVDNINDVVTEQANAGIDEVQASISYSLALAANVENLTLTGNAAINGTGNDDANIITGNTGNNILDGKGGADTLVGGKGNDTYIVDAEDDEVVENFNEGIDLVKAS
ncbi:MAG TPA: calcium-binding protein, partial [Methylophilus sp.]|uniref:beta strand repeat-containing protein n=1 Tax=Methylophilus sp. TaxID=29541 RepID=UPI002B9E4F12